MPDTPSRSRGRSDQFIKNTKSMIDIDRVLKENENSDFLLETQKAKTNAELERTFPGVEEDEKTLSGMYEPALHNFPLAQTVFRPSRPEVDESREYRSELTDDQRRRMFPKSQWHYEHGTGPADHIPQTRREQNYEESDLDLDTPNFGTERDERDYAGFNQGNPSSDYPIGSVEYGIGSERYWNHLDTYSRTSRANAELANSRTSTIAAGIVRRANSRTSINTSGTGSRVTRRSTRQDLVVRMRDRDAVADRISQSTPFAAGSVKSGRHSLRGGLYYGGEGWLPTRISPPDNPDYTVYSRDTPIAWRSNEQGSDVWHVPNVTYSSSSSNHQSIVRQAITNTHVSTVDESNKKLARLQTEHRMQGIHLPAKTYRISKDIETFHRPDEDGDSTVTDIALLDVQNHLDTILTPAVKAHKLTRGYINRKNRAYLDAHQLQLPIGGRRDTD